MGTYPLISMKRVSVIIPAHNEELHIEHAIRAIRAQKHPHFEVIVVDNASTDKTYERASAFDGITVLRELNKGTMWACECGRKYATGDIIVRMDADCQPDEDWLQRGAAHFDDDQIVFVSGPYDYHDGSPSFRSIALLAQKSLYKLIHEVLQLANAGAISMGGNSFMRASVLEKAGGFDTRIVFYGDDTELPTRLSKHGACVFDNGLIVRTSARRFKKQGTLNLIGWYIAHFFKQIFRSNKK
jgi:glycosyltransferase involved in cell wall biosynthesis